MNSFSDRLQAIVEYKNTTITEFERSVGVSKGVFSKAIKNETNITSNALQKIASYDPEINLNWLLTGNGNMLIEDCGLSFYEENEHTTLASVPKAEYGNDDSAGSRVPETTEPVENERLWLDILNNMSEALRRSAIANENTSVNIKNIMNAYSEEKKKRKDKKRQ